MVEPIPIPTKTLIPAIWRDDEELQELAEDLHIMGCEGLLTKPCNLRVEDAVREFKFERGNQWIGTKRRDPDNWTLEVWNRVYEFARGFRGLFRGLFANTSEQMRTQMKAFTMGIAGTLESGKCKSFSCMSLTRTSLSG